MALLAQFYITGGEQVAKDFRAARAELTKRYSQRTRAASFRAVRTIQTKYRGASVTSNTATRQGSGILRGSYGTQQTETNGTIESRIGLYRFSAKGGALIYGQTHEEGAVIKAKKGGALAIPLPSIRNPNGPSPKPSDFPRKGPGATFIPKGRGIGRGVICRKLADGSIQPLFALRTSVTIKARPPGGAINMAVDAEMPALTAGLELDTLSLLAGSGVSGGFR